MKILYVGDGRCRRNWGAQATSGALHDILASEHTISGIIPSSYKVADSVPILYNSLYPNKLLHQKSISSFWEFFLKLGKKVYKKEDFVKQDIEKAVELFLAKKDKHSRLKKMYQEFEKCDAVVLNGEGTIIFSTPPHRVALFFLFVLRLGQKMGKKTYFLNAMISHSPVSQPDGKFIAQMVSIFKDCNGIGLRDKESVKILHDISSEVPGKFIPDALFTWREKFSEKYISKFQQKDFHPKLPAGMAAEGLNFNQDYICISGGSATRYFTKDQVIDSFVSLSQKLSGLGKQIYLVPTCSGDEFLNEVAKRTGFPIIPLAIDVREGGAILANARVFVSGRFHPSILASIGNTPCVFMKSNSHKTLSLQVVLDYEEEPFEFEATPNEDEINQITEKVASILSQGDKLRNKISVHVDGLAKQAKEENLQLLKK